MQISFSSRRITNSRSQQLRNGMLGYFELRQKHARRLDRIEADLIKKGTKPQVAKLMKFSILRKELENAKIASRQAREQAQEDELQRERDRAGLDAYWESMGRALAEIREQKEAEQLKRFREWGWRK